MTLPSIDMQCKTLRQVMSMNVLDSDLVGLGG